MVFNAYQNLTKTKQHMLSLSEAHSLWEILHAKYFIDQHFELWKEFTHDIDLICILNYYQKHLKKDINDIETLMNKYVIKTPDRNEYSSNITKSCEIIRDEFIALIYPRKLGNACSSYCNMFNKRLYKK